MFLESVLAIDAKHLHLTDEQFFKLCQDNDFLRFERTADQQILITSPSGILTSHRNSDILTELKNWNRIYNLGYVFGSDAGFTLPNNAIRSPDVSFVIKSKIDNLSKEEKEHFAHVVPDFVVELMSPSDSLKFHQDKMKEYIDNGVQLGWLIDYKVARVYIYRSNGSIEIKEGFDHILTGENVLPNFRFDLKLIS
jgi:Uma2 family endonuclease